MPCQNKQNHPPSISVVLPVYNMELFIGESIESILNQSFTEFELIIIDDASTDGTRDRIRSYKDSRIIVLENEINLGNFPSRNRGLKIARGNYIAVMDGDDTSLPHRLTTQFEFMENNPEILACGSFNTLTASLIKLKQPYNFTDISHALLINSCFFHPSLFIRKQAIQKIGYYNEEYVYASDYDILCRLALQGKIMLLPEKLIHYRFHPGQITQSHAGEQRRFACRVRRKYQLAMIERYKYQDADLPCEADLSFPETGRAIFFYHYARNSGLSEYEKTADTILNNVLQRIHPGIPACLEKGLSGLCCGLIYLSRNGFMEVKNENFLHDFNQYIDEKYPLLEDDNFYYGKKGVDYYREQYKTWKKNSKVSVSQRG
jgi:glycosyltransferase involved in cell wall biosynthesis